MNMIRFLAQPLGPAKGPAAKTLFECKIAIFEVFRYDFHNLRPKLPRYSPLGHEKWQKTHEIPISSIDIR